jgi:hypothetical protein
MEIAEGMITAAASASGLFRILSAKNSHPRMMIPPKSNV